MEKITFCGTFDQYNYISGKNDFVELWDKLNFDLYNYNKNYLIEIPISILTITTLQSSVNLILGLRKIYNKNTQRINLNFIIDKTEYYSIKLLPKSYIDILEYTWSFMLTKINKDDVYKGFDLAELDQLQDIINYMSTNSDLPSDYILEQRKIFYKTIIENDTLNNKNFRALFSDLIDFYEQCERL